MLIPWGEPQRLMACGAGVQMWYEGSKVYIKYVTKNPLNLRMKYMYHVILDAKKPDIIQVHYYHCLSGYNTFVGAVLDPTDYDNWPIKENTPYMKKALEFNLGTLTPSLPVIDKPDVTGWEVVGDYTDEGRVYRVQRQLLI